MINNLTKNGIEHIDIIIGLTDNFFYNFTFIWKKFYI